MPRQNAMTVARAAQDAVVTFLAWLCAAAFAAALVLIVLDIGFRFLGIGSLPWSIELTEYALYGIAFLGAPWVLSEGAHVRMDALLNVSPRPVVSVLNKVTTLIALSASLVLVYYGCASSYSAWEDQMVTRKILNYPEWIVLIPIPVSGLLLTAECLLILFGARRDAPAIPVASGL